MHRRDFLSATAATAAALQLPPHLLAAPAEMPMPIEYIAPDPATGSSKAVVVGPGVSLAQTGFQQVAQTSASDSLADNGDECLKAVDAALNSAGASLSQAIKLNVVLHDESDATAARQLFARRFADAGKPAISYVTSALPLVGARLAIDAVAVCRSSSQGIVQDTRRTVAVITPGAKVYVSGQAEKASDLRSATRLTLESLRKTLEWMSLDLGSVKQVKSFLLPMMNQAEALDEIQKFFARQVTPPLAFVEWKSALPIEIELVASAAGMKPPSDSVGPIEFLTPPGMTASPVFSRVTRVWSDRTIYTSGLYGREGQDAEGQIRDIFAQLEVVLKNAGSDLRHMAKATYYVSTEEASAKLNAIRPEFYDPQRPPAASRAMVAGVGLPGRSITLDMIAVPKA